MYIHNLYNDLMLSTTILLDHTILNNSNYIQKYEFNLGNRTFQLPRDPKVNIDLPVAIVTINDEQASFGQRTETLKQFTGPNINNIKVLYNKTKNSFLYLHEESTLIPISITINTESQLQAKELSHIIKRYLPLNKYIMPFYFTSFLEIDDKFLNNIYFNPHKDNILNIFSKYNKLVGNTDFYFSVKYQPAIRLDSISAAAPDSSQRTFQITIDMTYLMQWPMYLFHEEHKIIEHINLNINTPEFNSPITNISPMRLFEDNKRTKNYIRYEETKETTINLTNSEHVYFNYQFEKQYHDITNKNTTYNLVSTKSDKFLYDIKSFSDVPDDNIITFKITREEYEKYFTPRVNNPIVLQIIEEV